MNKYIESSLKEIKDFDGIPSYSEVEKAKDWTKWNWNWWELIKNNENSYNCMCWK